jgi:diguanylate cyclase (GGDEF)-like protein
MVVRLLLLQRRTHATNARAYEDDVRALIADDDPVTRRLLDRMLRKLGYDTVLCADGTSAWAIMQSPGAPALALLDWLMPGMDGIEVCQRIRARANVPYTYVLIVSSKSDRVDVVSGMNAGADDYITKPVHPEELETRLKAGRRVLELQSALLRSREQMRDLAMRDALTGLLNRGAIVNALDNEILRVVHDQHDTAVVLADLDRFKAVNDKYGHLAGDSVLHEAGARLSGAVRASDYVGRYGGEEFLLVLPVCSGTSAMTLTNRVLERFREAPFAITGGTLPVSVSLGVAVAAAGTAVSAADLIREADEAMYQAKRAGGNCAVFAARVPAAQSH